VTAQSMWKKSTASMPVAWLRKKLPPTGVGVPQWRGWDAVALQDPPDCRGTDAVAEFE
jgi:hypothetical protein